MSTPNGEPQNPYTSAQPNQGQNQQYGQSRQYQQFGYQQSPNQNSPYQQGFQSYPNQGYPNQNQFVGSQLAQTSMILGIVSLFLLGIILGPIAIIKARQAEREFNTPATVGKVTGWIGLILGLIYVLSFVGVIVFAIMAPEASESAYSY